MKREDILKKYLTEEPKARERVNKVRALCNLLQRNHPSIQGIPKKVMEEIIDETISYERYWRKILLDHPELRGKDYNEKTRLSQEAQVNLGYEGGANVKLKI